MLRGLLGEEFTITGPDHAICIPACTAASAINPIRVLSRILASGCTTIPGASPCRGFMTACPNFRTKFEAQWQGLAFDHGKPSWAMSGLSHARRAKTGRTPLEMIWSRPTCEVNGIWGGYTGDGV